MKTFNNLYPQICSFENMLSAAHKAQKGKRYKTSTAMFNINLEKELSDLREALVQQTYTPGPYTEFYIYEPKKRKISAAPYRDRVVHHALYNVIEPIFENIFIYDSYANRKGKGTHKAILRYQEFCRKNRYVLKCDIQKYFPSIDFDILKTEIRRKISCQKTLWLIDTIIDHSNAQDDMFVYFPGDDLFTPWERRRGLPIGNLTSQFFANIYLNSFDHFIKETLHCKYYLRYVDDFALFHNDKTALHRIKRDSIDFLETYRVKLHVNKTRIYRCDEGLCFLGHRVFPDFRLLKKDNVIRFRRKLKRLQEEYACGVIGPENVQSSVQGWIGHASFSDTYRLRCKIFSEFVLKRDKLVAPPSSSRRFVEQQREQPARHES
ncbi:group II intron reverse transcriptase domain-containing protein [candidate division KSB1 bacterium]|nr:group II intron reverse transcriptase domain-containing protein [candidate division KSB1 bacterium]